MRDPILLDDWHPLAASASLAAGALTAAPLLDREVVLWRDSAGRVHAWEDRCPHRGTRLSIGRVAGDELICAYHGWRFAGDGRCTHFPALPGIRPSARACAKAFRVTERYGMVWVCLGTPNGEPPPFPEFDDSALRKVLCGPYAVAASAPRIVENFLDMAHFPFVHSGFLGEESHSEVTDCMVGTYKDSAGGEGIIATQCFFWQPRTNSRVQGGARIKYSYRVLRPLTAILTKHSAEQGGVHEAISLHVQPVSEESSRVWFVLAMDDFLQSDADLRAFQDTIFLQDKPVLENQLPKRMPLDSQAELSIRSDRLSVAYRDYLRAQGLCYGVT